MGGGEGVRECGQLGRGWMWVGWLRWMGEGLTGRDVCVSVNRDK